MRKRTAVKEAAARIAAGLPVEESPSTEVEKPALPSERPTETEAEPPKRRTRSSVVRGKDPAVDAPLYKAEADALKAEENALEQAAIDEDIRRRNREANQQADADGKTAADLTMGPGYDRIVTHLFQLDDPMKVYEEVRESLRMGRASAASYGQLVDALDEAEEAAMRAMDLLVNTKDAHDGFEIDAKIILGGMRAQASSILEDQKAKGLLKKTITNDDVEAVMAANHPDEWQDLERKRGRAKRTIDLLTALHEAARERAKDLRAMVSKFRGDT